MTTADPLPTLDAFVVSAWAPWCGPCRRMAPLVEEAARDYAGRVTLDSLSVEEDPGRCRELDVRSTPTLIGFRNGAELGRLVGEQDRTAIHSLFAAVAAERSGEAAAAIRSRPPRALLLLRLGVAAVLLGAGVVFGSIALLVVAAALAAWAITPRWLSRRVGPRRVAPRRVGEPPG